MRKNKRSRTGAASKPEVRRFRSISVQLTAFALLISLLPLLLVSVLLLWRMENMTEQGLTQSYQWLIGEHIGNVKDKLRQYEASLSYTAQNTTILDALADEGGNPYMLGSDVSGEVFKNVPMENRSEVHDCMVYATGPVAVYGTRASVFTEKVHEKWLNGGWNGGSGHFTDVSWEGDRLLSFVTEMYYVDVDVFTNEQVGLVRLDLYLEGLFEPAVGGEREYRVALFDEAGGCLYSSDASLGGPLEEWIDAEARLAGEVYSFDNYAVLQGEIPDYGLRILYLFDNSEMAGIRRELKRVVYPIALLIILVIGLCAQVYFNGFSRRVGELLEKFRIAGTGDLSPRPPIRGDDEIAVLDRRFGQMLEDMDAMNRRNDAQQNTIREAKYRNLQLQINPHFLYNTLETISAIGAMHGVFQVCDLCEKLGDIFRYSLGKNEGKYTTLARELRQTKNYIFIQQVRHRFEVFYSIEVDADRVYMLRFMLQPIVENAVQHGLAKKEGPGTLELYVGESDGDLEIRISDDGVGMTEEQLGQLRDRLEENVDSRENVSNIGVWNISQRIRLSCGEPYGLTVQSRPGQGSTFTLRLPMLTKEMMAGDEVQADDRG